MMLLYTIRDRNRVRGEYATKEAKRRNNLEGIRVGMSGSESWDERETKEGHDTKVGANATRRLRVGVMKKESRSRSYIKRELQRVCDVQYVSQSLPAIQNFPRLPASILRLEKQQ